jgi:hypothetical protein
MNINIYVTINLKINAVENRLTNNRIRWYRHVLGMNKEKIPEKCFEHESNWKNPRYRMRSK